MRGYSIQERSNNSLTIPNELMEFINKDTYSLIIKGSAGKGKTTLSLTILRALNKGNVTIFLRTAYNAWGIA